MERRPHLEVRRPRAAERPGAEEGAAQVGASGSRAGRRRAPAAGRAAAPSRLTTPACGQHVDRVLRAGDEQLRAGGAVERAAPVRPDLRLDPKRPEDRERTARDRRLGEVEVERDRAAAEEVDGAGRVEERRDLGEPVAAPRRARPRRARRVRRRRASRCSQERSLEREQPSLEAVTRRPVSPELVRLAAPCGDDAVAGHDEREAVRGAEAARRPRGPRTPGERREAAVRHDVAPPHGPHGEEQLPLEGAETRRRRRRRRRSATGVPREVRREPPAQIRHEAVTHL